MSDIAHSETPISEMTEAQRNAYIMRLQRAVLDMGREIGYLRSQHRGAVGHLRAVAEALEAISDAATPNRALDALVEAEDWLRAYDATGGQ